MRKKTLADQKSVVIETAAEIIEVGLSPLDDEPSILVRMQGDNKKLIRIPTDLEGSKLAGRGLYKPTRIRIILDLPDPT